MPTELQSQYAVSVSCQSVRNNIYSNRTNDLFWAIIGKCEIPLSKCPSNFDFFFISIIVLLSLTICLIILSLQAKSGVEVESTEIALAFPIQPKGLRVVAQVSRDVVWTFLFFLATKFIRV